MVHTHKLFFRIIFVLIFIALTVGILGKLYFVFNKTPGNQPKESGFDLSYIIATAPDNAYIKLSNSDGNVVSESRSQQPPADAMTGKTYSNAIQEIEYSKPESGAYYIMVSSGGNINGKIILYDRNGDQISKEVIGRGELKYKIDFNKNNSKESTISLQQ